MVVEPPQRWRQQHDSVFAQRNPSDTPATGFGSSRAAPFVPLRKLRIPFRLPPIIQDHLRMNVAPDQTIILGIVSRKKVAVLLDFVQMRGGGPCPKGLAPFTYTVKL